MKSLVLRNEKVSVSVLEKSCLHHCKWRPNE